ncbi:MAG: HAMP domain-containing protein, partial [Desulfobacterales bacterium]|nr:HAMP domain-containing protein [Desulfobacterales bacterium]
AGFIASSRSRLALSEQAEIHLSQIAGQKANEYALTFNRIKHEAQSIANYAASVYGRTDIVTDLNYGTLMPWDGEKYGNPEMNETLYAEKLLLQRVGLVLKSAVAENPYLSLGYLGTETGMTTFNDVKIVGVIEKLDGYVVTGRPWYTKAKKEKKTIWTAPYVDANTKKPVVTCATPVYGPDKALIGVVGFDVLLDTILSDILTLDIGYKSYAFIVDSKGKILVKPGMKQKNIRWNQTFKTDNLLQTKNKAFKTIISKMTRGKSGVAVYAEQDQDKYLAHEPLRAIDAGMAIVASRDEVIRPAITIQNYILMVWVAVLVVSILIGLVFGNTITKPIKLLARQADLMSQGKTDLDVIPEDRADEIGVLTKAFNRLVISLRIAMSR